MLARIGRTDLLGSFTVLVQDCCLKGWNWSRRSTGREDQLVEKINTVRATPLVPFEKVGLTKRVRSSWLRRSFGR
jgi:hypothetical protein